jgi:Zn-dependent peptidase ImmA (M78 family)
MSKIMPLNRISIQRQREIEDMVHSILLSTGLSYPENSLLGIIKANIPDVVLVEDDFGGKDIRGAIFRKSDKFRHPLIAIQANQSAGAKTFALAHEFGHYVLNHNEKDNYFIDTRPFDGSRPMQDEGEANFFAATLLMPKDEFLRLDQPFVTDAQLAERFGVSPAAARVRREWLSSNNVQ